MSWLGMLWRAARRCPVCGARWCAVYGGIGTETPHLASIYLMHRGFQR